MVENTYLVLKLRNNNKGCRGVKDLKDSLKDTIYSVLKFGVKLLLIGLRKLW